MLHDIFHNIVALTSFISFYLGHLLTSLYHLFYFIGKKKGRFACVVITPHPMVHCHLGFLVSSWVIPVHSKVYRYLTSLPCFMHFEVQVNIRYLNPQPLGTWFKLMGLFESCITYHLNNYEFFMTLFVTLNLLIKNL